MSDQPKASDDGILGKARRLASQVGEYARSDEAREKLDVVKKKAVEVGGMATAGARKLVEGTRQAAAQARAGTDEFSKSEDVRMDQAGAKGDRDEIQGEKGRAPRLSESPVVVALAILIFFPLGLFLLWKHPTLSRSKTWWWIGGLWSILAVYTWLTDEKEKKPAAAVVVPATTPLERAGLASDVLESASRRAGKEAGFNLWTAPLTVLTVDRPDSGNWVREIDFSPDGKFLITQGRLWATDDWRLLNSEGRSRIHGGLFSPDGRLVASAWGGELLVWSIDGGVPEVVETMRVLDGRSPKAWKLLSFPYTDGDVRWTPFGAATGGDGTSIKASKFPFLEAGTRRPSFEIDRAARSGGNACFAFSAPTRLMARLFDSSTTLAANGIPGYEELPHRERIVEVWAWPGGGEAVFRTKVEGDSGMAYANQIAFLPGGRTFVITQTQHYTKETDWKDVRHVVFFDTATWKETNRFKSTAINFRIAAISPDGSMIATTSGSSQDFTVTLWSPASSEPIRAIKALYADQVLFMPDGRTLVTAVGGGGTLKRGKTYHINFYDIATGTCIGRIKDQGVCSIAISPDGQYLVSGHGDSVAKVWDLRRGQAAPYEDEYEEYNQVQGREAAEAERLSRPAPPITQRAFESLMIGMSYDQVRRIVGGSEHFSKSVSYKSDPKYYSYRTVHILSFRGNGEPGSGAVLVFGSDGIANLPACKLIEKEEIGLK